MITYNRSANDGSQPFAEFSMALSNQRKIVVKAFNTAKSYFRISIAVGDTATVNLTLFPDDAVTLGDALRRMTEELPK
jgi:hypothetical protein